MNFQGKTGLDPVTRRGGEGGWEVKQKVDFAGPINYQISPKCRINQIVSHTTEKEVRHMPFPER